MLNKQSDISKSIFAFLPMVLSAGGLFVFDQILWVFWVVFPMLPLLALSTFKDGRAHFGWPLCGVVVFAFLDSFDAHPAVFLGDVLGPALGLGAAPFAIGLGVFAVGVGFVGMGVWLMRKSLATLVSVVAVWGLVIVVTVFHIVVVNMPFNAARGHLNEEMVQIWGTPCQEGCVSSTNLSDFQGFVSERLSWTLQDIEFQDSVRFCWIESDVLLDDSAKNICVSKSEGVTEVRVFESQIAPFVEGIRLGFVTLCLLFISAWSLGVTYVIHRHKDYVWRAGKWQILKYEK